MANKSMLYSLKCGAHVARMIPRNVGLRIAASFAWLYGLFPTRLHKKIASIHSVVSPHATRSQLRQRVRSVLASYAQYWWDVFWLSTPRSVKDIDTIVTVENYDLFLDHVAHAQKNKTGIILVLPHMGSWELPGAWLAMKGHPPVVVAERLSPPELFEIFTSTRTRAGMTVIAHDDHPTSKLMSALQEGKIVCLVADRDISRRGLEVDFFGKKKSMPVGPCALALKTGAVILPLCMYTTHDGHIDVTFSDAIAPIEVNSDEEKSQALFEMTQQMAHTFEKMISRDPSQWHVLAYEWSQT